MKRTCMAIAISLLFGFCALNNQAQTVTLATDKQTYDPGAPIEVTFAGGPGNAKDWIGIYYSGQTLGEDTPAIFWQYVDGTKTGTTPVTDGTLFFTQGLFEPGNYVIHFLEDDGYISLATANFTIAESPMLLPSHTAYYPDELISIAFRNGPGNPKDWIGIYSIDHVPGTDNSTIWRYVDNTANGTVGVTDGTVTPGSLSTPGDWKVLFLLNDGYTILASNLIQVVDPSFPLVRLTKREYLKGETIQVAFTNGPANPKDWIGIYRADEVPSGSAPLLVWEYVDGTQSGTVGYANGTITFSGGLTNGGTYTAYLFLNDGYTSLAGETFTVLNVNTTPAKLISTTPANGATNLPPVYNFTARLLNGSSKVDTNSITVKLDGANVPVSISVTGDEVTVQSSPQGLPDPNSTHVFQLSFRDDAIPANTVTENISFTIADYENIALPAPLYFENFDAVPEGQLPAGWTEQNFTDGGSEEIDFRNLDSAAYKIWTVVNVDRFTGSFVAYSDPADQTEDYQRVLTPNPMNVVNGQVITGPLASGRMLFGNSGYRNGNAQILYVFSPDFDLTGKTNVHLSYHALWEQNQDSMGAVEYSIDQGATWLPIVYMIATVDVITNETGGIDAVATLTEQYGDVPHYTDPNTSEDKGGNYGAFIGAEISEALAPFISPRLDDNPAEGKKVELFRLTAADNQAKVRFRFAHAGWDSWYFGVDNFGLYSMGGATTSPTLNVSKGTGTITLQWDAAITGYRLESTPTLSNPDWQPVSGVANNSVTLPTDGPARFFRLHQQ